MTQIPQIDAKIYLALAAHTNTFTGAAVYYSPNVPVKPDVGSPYVVVDDVRLDFATRYVQGGAVDEYRGIWNVSVMVPMSWTGAQAMGLAAKVADHFDKGARYAASGVSVQIMKRPRIVGAGFQDAGMIRFPVQVEWRSVG